MEGAEHLQVHEVRLVAGAVDVAAAGAVNGVSTWLTVAR